MSNLKTSGIGTFTRGGQVTIHFIRMISQVIRNFFMLGIFVLLTSTFGLFWVSAEAYDRYVATKYIQANLFVSGFKQTNSTMSLSLKDGRTVEVNSVRFLSNKAVKSTINELIRTLVWSVMVGGLLTVLILYLVGKFILGYGKSQTKNSHVRGGKLVDTKTLSKKVRKYGAVKRLSIAGVPMPLGADVQHTLMIGAPGSGKSTVTKEMLTCARRSKQRAIVYDSSGEYVSIFYRQGIDTILNPFDERTRGWDVWCECKHDFEYARLAESLIPDQNNGADPIWVLGARIVFVALVTKIGKSKEPSNQNLMHAITSLSIDDITSYLKNTEAASIISEGGEKMAISMRGTLAAYTNSLKYLPVDRDVISVKDWVGKDEGDGWLFLTSTNQQRTAMKPLISVWMDTAISAISSLNPSRDRRIWFAIDELPTLNKLPSLGDGLATVRKFGGCFLLGMQASSQLEVIYSAKGAESITGTCSTWCVFRCNSKETASFAAANLGDSETVETLEGISFGADTLRDGVSLSKQVNLRQIVLPAEIMNLEDLTCYLKFGRGMPVAQVQIKHVDYKNVSEGFIEKLVTAAPNNIRMVNKARDDSSVSNNKSVDTNNNTKTLSEDLDGSLNIDTDKKIPTSYEPETI